MDRNESDRNWLEPVLRQELTQVEAPQELSERLRNPRTPRTSDARPLAWAFAAALVVAAGVWGMRAHESHAAGPPLGDMAQIGAWVKSSTGLDLGLPGTLPSSVRILDVRVVDPAAPAVEVSYQVSGREAKLLVARASGSPAVRHADLKNIVNDGRTTWVAHGQTYTLSASTPEDARGACLLCHAS